MASDAHAPVRVFGFTFNHASNAIFLIQAAMVCLYGGCTRFASDYAPAMPTSGSDVTSMVSVVFTAFFVFAGLAYITIAASRYMYNSIAYTFFYVATAIQWSILMLGFWQQANLSRVLGASNRGGWGWTAINIDNTITINALYIAAAIIISFGAVAGRISFMGGFVALFVQIFACTANFQIAGELKINDFGGSSFIHLWGATFGLVLSFMLRNKANRSLEGESKARSTGSLALIGTALLFVTYPVFNVGNMSYLISRNGGSVLYVNAAIFRGFFNTLMALCSSVATAFMASKAVSAGGDKFALSHVQRAMVAGGAAIASTAPMLKNPWGALLVGALAGVLSVYGQAYWTPALAAAGFSDSTGVFAAHWLPGFLAALSSSVAAARVVTDDAFDAWTQAAFLIDGRSALTQGGHQMAFAIVTITFAALWAVVTGALINLPLCNPKAVTATDDAEEWVDIEDGEEAVAAAEAPAAADPAPVKAEAATAPAAEKASEAAPAAPAETA